jgi:hypothetical protein
MYILLCVLRDEIKDRNEYLYRIRVIILNNLKNLEIPVNRVEEPYSTNLSNLDIEYALNLILLSRYLLLFQE